MSHLVFPDAMLASGKPYVYRSLDLKTVTSTVLWTPTADVLPLFVVIRVVTATAVLTPATLSIGTNAATYTNIVPATALTNLDAVDEQFTFPIAALGITVPSGAGIRANVSVAATGTALAADIWLVGVRD